jgi:hypothetical protein
MVNLTNLMGIQVSFFVTIDSLGLIIFYLSRDEVTWTN